MITQKRLKELLHYDHASGVWNWRIKRRGLKQGARPGYIAHNGYRLICLDQKKYQSGRLAVLYMTGKLPSLEIDHKNNIRDDDRYENLRQATRSQQTANVAYCEAAAKYHGEFARFA